MARAEASSRKACCLVSELLEQAGFDRQKVRKLRRQILEGIVLFCQWQLQRMNESNSPPSPSRKTQRVRVE
jgi:hypothetical protein